MCTSLALVIFFLGAGGKEFFLANWALFLKTEKGMSLERVIEHLNVKQKRSGKPFDVYGFYRALVTRGGYRHRELAKENLKMTEVYDEMDNYRPGHTYTLSDFRM